MHRALLGEGKQIVEGLTDDNGERGVSLNTEGPFTGPLGLKGALVWFPPVVQKGFIKPKKYTARLLILRPHGSYPSSKGLCVDVLTHRYTC